MGGKGKGGKGDKGSGKGDKGNGKGDKGSGKGKTSGKKGDKGEDKDEKVSNVYTTDGRPYSAALQELFKGTAVRPTDIDPKAVQLFDALAEAGKADAAVTHLAKSLEGVAREKVANWRAYVFTLLRSFDSEVYNGMKDQRGRPRPRRKDEKITVPLVTTELKATAPAFVPGQPWQGAIPASEALRPAATPPAAAPAATAGEAKADNSAPEGGAAKTESKTDG